MLMVMIRAAAMWRSNALPDERELQAWDRESYRIWLEKCEGLGKHEKVTNAITVSSISTLSVSSERMSPSRARLIVEGTAYETLVVSTQFLWDH
jgi:hypothetical protein